MWQVYLYLANERQAQERRTAHATRRTWRRPFARRVADAPTTTAREPREAGRQRRVN